MLTIQSNPIQLDAARTANPSQAEKKKTQKLALVNGNDSHIIHHHHTSLAVSRLGSTLPPNSPTEKKHVQAARGSR